MPNQEVQDQIEKAELIHAVDDTRAADDPPEAAGVSNTTTVSVVQFSPLTPGVTYEFWLVGVNSQGEGPQSNHVTHAVPVGP